MSLPHHRKQQEWQDTPFLQKAVLFLLIFGPHIIGILLS